MGQGRGRVGRRQGWFLQASGACGARARELWTHPHQHPKHTPTLNTPAPGNKLVEREIVVTLAPGQLDHKALGTLTPVSSAVDPKLSAKTLSLRCGGSEGPNNVAMV